MHTPDTCTRLGCHTRSVSTGRFHACSCPPAATAPWALVEAAVDPTWSGAWGFDASWDCDPVQLSPAQHAAAVRVVSEPENADCERELDCAALRPVLIVDGRPRKHGPDVIGFHLADDPDTGADRMVFTPFWVNSDGQAVCEACATAVLDVAGTPA